MTEPTYQIVFRGKLLTGFDRNQVRANLAQLFKSDPARIDALLDSPKTVLKAGLNKEAAGRYQEVLRHAGIMVAVIGGAPAASTTAARPQTEAPATAGRLESAPVNDQANPPERVAPPSGLSLAAAGARIIDAPTPSNPHIDTSGFSLAAVGVTLAEVRAIKPPEYNLAGISIASDTGPIDASPRPAAARIDTSALSLAAVPAETADKPLSELQKLLSTAVD